jgi:signal transduction histidine kinase
MRAGPHPQRPPRHVLPAGFSRAAWRESVFAAAGSVVLLPVVVDLAIGGVSPFDGVLGPLVGLLYLTALALLPWTLGWAGRAQRSRIEALLGHSVPVQPPFPGQPGWRALWRARSTPALRRSLGYHLIASPCFALAGIAVVLLWLSGVLLVAAPAYLGLLPDSGPLGSAATTPLALILAGCGLFVLWLAGPAARLVSALDVRAASALLGPDRERELEARVAGLTESRSALVQAVDAERRRIERDLHDGTQQRLVSLAIGLGLARATLGDLPPEVDTVLATAHEEAKAALAELRDLVRGLHPAVLDDRGLDAALSGIAARAPLPVRLAVDLPRRPVPTVEAVAYFVVSEALANVAKHSCARQATVEVDLIGERLLVRVADDGIGGADAALGSGLTGLAQRAASVDGTFELSSPVGGPTVITVELPCVS